MILRNVSPHPQPLIDGTNRALVAPQGVISVSPETGMRLLADAPRVWTWEHSAVGAGPSTPVHGTPPR